MSTSTFSVFEVSKVFQSLACAVRRSLTLKLPEGNIEAVSPAGGRRAVVTPLLFYSGFSSGFSFILNPAITTLVLVGKNVEEVPPKPK